MQKAITERNLKMLDLITKTENEAIIKDNVDTSKENVGKIIVRKNYKNHLMKFKKAKLIT